MDKYLIFTDEVEIREYSNELKILVIRRSLERKKILGDKRIQNEFKINDTGIEIMALINGKNTYEDIINILSGKYNEDKEDISLKVGNFLHMIQTSFDLHIIKSHEKVDKPIKIRREGNLYPLVATIELTYKCNLRCKHCYGEYSIKNKEEMHVGDVKKVLIDLRNLGVRVIEFTGGDITMHSQFEKILEEALDIGFSRIVLLTNGVALSESVIDIIIKNKDIIAIQIDVHSLKEDYVKWFTGCSNTIEKIKNNILKLINNNVFLRVATIVTPKNIDELDEIAYWVNSKGIKNYSISPVTQLGRAKDDEENELLFKQTDIEKFINKIDQLNKKYGFFNNKEDTIKRPNCGCITSQVTIAPNGEIKFCTMDNMKYFDFKIGNVIKDNIRDLYDNNSKLIGELYKTEPPNVEMEECKECESRYFCAGCMLRGCISAKDKGEKCKWYHKSLEKQMKEQCVL